MRKMQEHWQLLYSIIKRIMMRVWSTWFRMKLKEPQAFLHSFYLEKTGKNFHFLPCNVHFVLKWIKYSLIWEKNSILATLNILDFEPDVINVPVVLESVQVKLVNVAWIFLHQVNLGKPPMTSKVILSLKAHLSISREPLPNANCGRQKNPATVPL